MNDERTNERTKTHACDSISRQDAIDAAIGADMENHSGILSEKRARVIESHINTVQPADVQPVTFCKYCQLRADVKDVDTGEMYHTCGVLGFDVPDGFACNQGKRKGAGTEC